MKSLKRLLVFYLLLLSVPFASAEIIISMPNKTVYNLGEKIALTVSVKENQDYNGFFKMNLMCDDYRLQYYASPLNLDAGVRTQIEIPELTFFDSMKGNCRIKAGFDSSDGANVDTASSNELIVTDVIRIVTDEFQDAKPGEELVILANVEKQSKEILSKGKAEIHFMDVVYYSNLSLGKLEYKLDLGYEAEGSIVPLKIAVTDKYKNYGEKSIDLNVLQVPTSIGNQIDSDVLMPGDSFRAKITVYDHGGRVIENGTANVKVFDPGENPILEDEIKSTDYLEFATDKYQAPGVYFLLSAYKGITEQSTFTITALRKISMKQEDNLVHVENIGNVEYNDETTLVLKNDDKNYLINKKIELKPGQIMTIDLSKEVPGGVYDIILPEEVAADLSNKDENEIPAGNENTTETEEQANVIKDVQIDDGRSVIKKATDGFGAISGAVVSATSYVISKPLLASTILITIILGIVTYYGGGFIKNKVAGKKPGKDTSELFKDFDYEEK